MGVHPGSRNEGVGWVRQEGGEAVKGIHASRLGWREPDPFYWDPRRSGRRLGHNGYQFMSPLHWLRGVSGESSSQRFHR